MFNEIEDYIDDIRKIKKSDKRFLDLTDNHIYMLYSEYSDLSCAGWLMIDEIRIKDFIEYCFTTPFEMIKKREV